jgi:hypothetical protein
MYSETEIKIEDCGTEGCEDGGCVVTDPCGEDLDGDGVGENCDDCPGVKGKVKFNGCRCPGVPDNYGYDDCMWYEGSISFQEQKKLQIDAEIEYTKEKCDELGKKILKLKILGAICGASFVASWILTIFTGPLGKAAATLLGGALATTGSIAGTLTWLKDKFSAYKDDLIIERQDTSLRISKLYTDKGDCGCN